MAAAHVQTQQNNVNNGTSLSVTLTLTAGNAVIVTLCADTSLAGLGSPTQSAGDTLAFTCDNSLNPYVAQYLNHAVAGGSTTFTFTWSNPQLVRLFVTEVSGLVTSSAFDKTAVDGAGTTNATTHSSGTTATTTQADEFALAAFNVDGSGTNTLSSLTNSFTVPTNGNQNDGAGPISPKCVIAYKVLSAAGTVETTATFSDNTSGNGMVGTYKAAAAGGGQVVRLWNIPLLGVS